MAIEIDLSEESEYSENFDKSLLLALRRMMRTAFSYAADLPTNVYMYMKFDKNNVAQIDFLFKVNEKIVEVHKLNDAKLKGHKFDVSTERQEELQKYVAQELGEMLIPAFLDWDRKLPDEIYAWIDVTKNYPFSSLVYNQKGYKDNNSTVEEKILEWKHQIEKPIESELNGEIMIINEKLTASELEEMD